MIGFYDLKTDMNERKDTRKADTPEKIRNKVY